MDSAAEDDAAALAQTLNSLSIYAPVEGTAEPQRTDTASLSPKQTPQNYFNSQRRSSAASGFAAKSPTSPKLNRKPSSSFNKADTPTKLLRTPSAPNSPKPPPGRHSSVPANDADPAPVSAAAVASSHMKQELDLHFGAERAAAETVIIIHDSCYGHRYARPKTSKTTLGFIVERPERIQAGVLGLACAYIRLKGIHTQGRNAPHPVRQPDRTIPFVIHRSTNSIPLTTPAVTSVHGTKWMQDLHWMCNMADSRLASGAKELGRPDESSQAAKPKLHEGDLYLCKESLNALQGALGGVIDGVDAVFRSVNPAVKRAFVSIRPPGHHCSGDMPSGFCWLNNVHIGIEHAAQTHGLTHAAIIDFDLHHGDGSQSITWERNIKASKAPKNAPASKKTSIGYFSLHDINSYPCEYGDASKVQSASLCMENAHGQSIWNVHLQPWTTEADFWQLYHTRYCVLIEKARAFLRMHTERIKANSPFVQPKAAIFLSAGFDASQWEGEGMQRHKVNVPTDFYARFTADVVKMANEDGTGVDGRVISVLEGGYSDRALTSGVFAHIVGLSGLSGDENVQPPSEWWSSSMLSELELLLRPPVVAPVPKKSRNIEPPTYTSPTQSFSAKVVDPSKIYRSISGSSQHQVVERPPTPPPPEVEWSTAAHELSKLLIPSDRSVGSFKHEELAEYRVTRERHSSMGLTSSDSAGERMQLRGRKAKAPPPVAKAEGDFALPVRPASRTTRRRTISDLPRPDGDLVHESNSAVTPTEEHGRPSSGSSVQLLKNETSNSNAVRDDGSVVPPLSAPSNGNAINVRKTRRMSGLQTNIAPNGIGSTAKPSARPNPKTGGVLNAAGASQPATAQSGNVSADVDSLTSGVKKITLKMPANTAKDTKAAAKAPARPANKAPLAKPTKNISTKTAAARGPKPTDKSSGRDDLHQAPPSASLTPVQLEDQSSVALSAFSEESPFAPQSSIPINNLGEKAMPLSTAASTDFTAANNAIAQDSTPSADGRPTVEQAGADTWSSKGDFVHYIPPVDVSAATLDQHTVQPTSLTWLPPNTNTPTQTPIRRGREDLPIFTSYGPIPFATHSDASEKENSTPELATEDQRMGPEPTRRLEEPTSKTLKENVWEVPDTPTR